MIPLILNGVGWADDASATALVENVGVDHGRLDVFVTEEFLNSADVVSGHQEVRGERVSEGVAACSLCESCISCGLFDGFLDHRFVEVVASDGIGSGVGAAGTGREDILPSPIDGGVWVLAFEGGRHVDSPKTIGEIPGVNFAYADEKVLYSLSAGTGQQGCSVFMAFAVADGDCAEGEVDVLDSEPQALEDPHSGAVEQQDDELSGALEAGEECGDFFTAENGGEPFGLAGADDVFNPWRFDLEDVPVEKEDGAEGLALGGGGDVVLDGEVGKKAVEVVGVEFLRMPPVEPKEPIHPAEIGLFGSDGVVPDPDRASHLVKEAWSLGSRSGGGCVRHGINRT